MWYLYLGYYHQNPVRTPAVQRTCCVSRQSYSYLFNYSNNIWWEVKIMTLHIVLFPLPCYLVSLRQKYILQHPMLWFTIQVVLISPSLRQRNLTGVNIKNSQFCIMIFSRFYVSRFSRDEHRLYTRPLLTCGPWHEDQVWSPNFWDARRRRLVLRSKDHPTPHNIQEERWPQLYHDGSPKSRKPRRVCHVADKYLARNKSIGVWDGYCLCVCGCPRIATLKLFKYLKDFTRLGTEWSHWSKPQRRTIAFNIAEQILRLERNQCHLVGGIGMTYEIRWLTFTNATFLR